VSVAASVPTVDRLVMLVPIAMQAAFFFALGASVGSFVNVVAGRWPAGQDFVAPPSRCETCGRTLAWWENVPIVSWIALRGRCRTCGVSIGPHHLFVELGAALLFGATVLLLFGGPHTSSPAADAQWWTRLGAWGASPALVAVLCLWGCLLAASLIDAKTGYIPLGVTTLALAVALVAMTVQGAITRAGVESGWPAGLVTPAWRGAGLGGGVGTAVAATLLAKGWLPRSFASFDPIAEVPASAARREVLKEFAFLAPPAVGAALGAIALGERAMPPTLAALSTALLGMLVAAGAIWLTRIFGTLAFGREAMGLGDVHLMAAAGAVIGWRDGLLVYLAAPFIALAWVAVSGGLARMRGRAARELPYGPHLAMACVVVFLGRPWLVPLARSAFGVG
jgi:leader peptidase (prepilin peptidase)/N-methyltransferase